MSSTTISGANPVSSEAPQLDNSIEGFTKLVVIKKVADLEKLVKTNLETVNKNQEFIQLLHKLQTGIEKLPANNRKEKNIGPIQETLKKVADQAAEKGIDLELALSPGKNVLKEEEITALVTSIKRTVDDLSVNIERIMAENKTHSDDRLEFYQQAKNIISTLNQILSRIAQNIK